MKPIIPHLWFDRQAEEAVAFYLSVFRNGKINRTSRYSEVGQEIHKMPPGSVMTVEFELNGQAFMALNGGPVFTFNESISFMVPCKDQEEIDYYWERLSEGGDKAAQECGWLKDKFGVSWQVIPARMSEWIADPEIAPRVTAAFMKMKKMDLAALEAAAKGA